MKWASTRKQGQTGASLTRVTFTTQPHIQDSCCSVLIQRIILDLKVYRLPESLYSPAKRQNVVIQPNEIQIQPHPLLKALLEVDQLYTWDLRIITRKVFLEFARHRRPLQLRYLAKESVRITLKDAFFQD